MTSAKYIYDLARLRKLKKYWGTTTVDGVEVFVRKKYYYPSMDESTEKLAKYLGIYSDLTAKQEGVEKSWLYLNPEKATDLPSGTSVELIGKNLQNALRKVVQGNIQVVLTLGAKITTEGNTTTLTPPSFIADVSDQPALISEVLSSLPSMYSDNYSVEVSEEDPYITALAVYGLLHIGNACVLEKVTETLTVLDREEQLPTGASFTKTEVVPSYALHLKFSNTLINASSPISSAIRSVITSPISTADKTLKARLTGFTLSDYNYHDVRVTPSSYWLGSEMGTYYVEETVYDPNTDSYTTVNVPRSIMEYYLKTSLFDDTTFKREERIRYFLDLIDSDYKKEKLKWYEKLAVLAIIIVAVILAIPSGGASFATAAATVAYIATIVTVAALYIAIATYALSLMGAHNVAAATGQFLKSVDPLVKIAGIYLIVYSIVQKAAQEAAKKEAAKQIGAEAAERTFVDVVMDYTKVGIEQVTGVTDMTNMTTEHVLKMTGFSFDIYKDWKTRDLHDEINDYRKELAELQQAQEYAQTSDILKEVAASFPNLIAKDNSIYAAQYDRPYEWWSTPYHSGNIQATTVNALWLS